MSNYKICLASQTAKKNGIWSKCCFALTHLCKQKIVMLLMQENSNVSNSGLWANFLIHFWNSEESFPSVSPWNVLSCAYYFVLLNQMLKKKCHSICSILNITSQIFKWNQKVICKKKPQNNCVANFCAVTLTAPTEQVISLPDGQLCITQIQKCNWFYTDCSS